MKSWFKNKFGKDRANSRSNSKNDMQFNRLGEDYRGQGRHQSVYLPENNIFEKSSGKDEHGRRLSNMSNQSNSSASSAKLTLPIDFAGRVLKLEMQIEKGSNYVTMDDISNLMDLYTQAGEFYNCA